VGLHVRRAVVVAAALAACSPSEPPRPPPRPPAAGFAFGVFGDAPYGGSDERAYRRLLEDVSRSGLAFLIHIGDLHGGRCADEVIEQRYRSLSSLPVPVIYTPGDNEWTDCHRRGGGGFAPLERLQRIRSIFFSHPRASLGASPIVLESQSAYPAWAEFVENARWVRAGFVFATVHLVGSANGTEPFATRSSLDDDAARRRVAAAIAWLDAAFAIARRDSLHGVVVAMHADPYIELRGPTNPYEPFLARLAEQVSTFDGVVVLLHGDSHAYRVDHPLRRAGASDTLRNFTRVETFGSPDVGWLRIVVDTAKGTVASVEPRLMSK